MTRENDKMPEAKFIYLFERGRLDAEFAMFISERFDAWSKAKMLSYWDDPDAYDEFKETLVTSTMLQDAYFEGKNPLESFPSLKWGSK
jgi:hypothetical protein